MKKYLLMACITLAGTILAAEPENIVRAYNNPQGGYVVVNDNDELIGFFENGSLTDETVEQLRIFTSIMGQELRVMNDKNLPKRIASEVEEVQVTIQDSVGPLLKDIAYNQGYPYNLWTPIIGNDHAVTGCVATAMSQIMARWRYPRKCASTTIDYKTSTMNIPLAINYDTIEFDWSKIQHTYSAESTDEQRQEVAKLMYACGVSVHMNYTNGSSGSVSTRVAGQLKSVFKYKSGGLETVADVGGDAAFEKALIDEFDAGRPVYCSGTTTEAGMDANHAFVLDGYGYADSSHSKAFVHFNWGWGGSLNGWYRLTGGSVASGRSFYTGFSIVRGIEPAESTALTDAISDSQNDDNRIFDILGREVKQTIPGQIYICGGKKFIAR